MGLQVRKLTLDGDAKDGQGVFARLYDGLLSGWQNKRPEGMRDFLKLLDALQEISSLRSMTDEQLAAMKERAAAAGMSDWEQSEHDRVLLPGEQKLLLTDADFQKLKSCFEKTDFDPRMARAVVAAQNLLEAAPLVDAEEKKD